MATDPATVHRRSRWLSVRVIAFGLRHGLDEAEAMRALGQAYRCSHCGPAWRLAVLEDAQMRNTERRLRKLGWRKLGPLWHRPPR